MAVVVASCAFKILRASRPGRGKPVLIGLLARFSRQNEVLLRKLTNLNQTSVAPNPLVLLFGRCVMYSRRKRGNRHRDQVLYITLAALVRQGLTICCCHGNIVVVLEII